VSVLLFDDCVLIPETAREGEVIQNCAISEKVVVTCVEVLSKYSREGPLNFHEEFALGIQQAFQDTRMKVRCFGT
jgi:hypothetical protein